MSENNHTSVARDARCPRQLGRHDDDDGDDDDGSDVVFLKSIIRGIKDRVKAHLRVLHLSEFSTAI